MTAKTMQHLRNQAAVTLKGTLLSRDAQRTNALRCLCRVAKVKSICTNAHPQLRLYDRAQPVLTPCVARACVLHTRRLRMFALTMATRECFYEERRFFLAS